MWEMLQCFNDTLISSFNFVVAFCWAPVCPELVMVSQVWPEQWLIEEKDPLPKLFGSTLPTEPRMLLVCPCRAPLLVFTTVTPRTPRSFSAKLLSCWVNSSTCRCLELFSPGSGLYIFFPWTLWGWCQHISPACQNLFEEQHNPLVYQLPFSCFFHQRTC